MLTVMLAVLYPFLAHAAVVGHSDALTAASLACLALAGVVPGIRAGRPSAWLWAILLFAGIWALYSAHIAGVPLYAPPAVIDIALAFAFGSTLRRGQRPLIERLVRLLHDPQEQLDPAIPVYARRLTLAWTLLFSILASTDLALALCIVPGGILDLAGLVPPVRVRPEAWSIFANFLGFLVVVVFFLIEYAYRQYRFPKQPYRNMLDFLQRASRVGRQVFRTDQ